MNMAMSHLLLHPNMVDSRDSTFRHVQAPHSVLQLCLIPVLTSPLTPTLAVFLLSKMTSMNGKRCQKRSPLGARVEPRLLPRPPVIHHSSQQLGRTDGQRLLRVSRRKKTRGPIMAAKSRGCCTIEASNIAPSFVMYPVFLDTIFSLYPASILYHSPSTVPHLFP